LYEQHANPLGRTSRHPVFSLLAVCIAGLLLFFVSPPVHALPAGFQEYYVLGYEEHVWRAFDAIYSGTIPSQICSTVSLVATADHQVIYYDHWEDGYEIDLLDPVQNSTEVYTLQLGASLSLTSTQSSGPTINRFVPVPRSQSSDPSNLRYDGGDRIITSGGPVALTHIIWPLGSSWAGGGWEIYSHQTYARTYSHHLPVGEDLYDFGGGDTGTYGDFRDVYLHLGAFEKDTVVSIDNGDDVLTLPLGQGQTYTSIGYVNSNSAPTVTINSGTVVHSNKPVQLGLLTGADSPRDVGLQSRFLMVMPDQQWGADYIVPIPRGDNTPLDGRDAPAEVYLSNPNDFPITVSAYDRFTRTTFAISPNSDISSTIPYSTKRGSFVPQDSAARFTSADGVFGVIVCADTSDYAYDWGFSGIPAKYLTRDYYVSWAPGNACSPPDHPTCDRGLPAVNGSPVWVTPLANDTSFYVDFGPLDGVVDETFTLDTLEQRRVFDNIDKDNTGMHIWAIGEFAIAWGEDPRTAGGTSPYLDLGLVTLPLLQRWLDPVLTIDKTAEPTILPPTGGTVTFTLTAQSYDTPLIDVDISDTLPIRWTYVPNSTHVTYPDGSVGNPEPADSGLNLFWDLSARLDVNQSLTLSFQAQITDALGVSISTNQVEAVGRDEFLDTVFNPTDEAIVYISPIHVDKSVNSTQTKVGDTLVYTLSYANISPFITITNAVLHDVVPIQHITFQSASEGGAYDPASSTVTWDLGTLTPGASGTTVLTATVNGFVEEGTVVENTAYLASDQAARVGSNSARTTVLAPDVQLIKSVPIGAYPGDQITYTLFYENVGGAPATGVTVQDIIPPPTTYVTGSLSINTGAGWAILTEDSDADQGAYVSRTVLVTPGVIPGTVAPGETGQIRFALQLDPDLPLGSFVQNWATLDRDLYKPSNTNLGVTYISDLLIHKAARPTRVVSGDTITYTVIYTNASATTSQTAVYVLEQIPDYTSLVTVTESVDAQVEYSWDSGTTWSFTRPITPVTHIRWYDAEVPPNTQVTLGFTVQVTTTMRPRTAIRNTAYITSTSVAAYFDDWVPSNQVEVGVVDLWVTKRANQDTAQPCDLISYTISYGNRGSADVPGVQILDTLPVGTDYVTGSIWGVGANVDDAPDLLWDVGTVIAGASGQQVGYAVALDCDLLPDTVITNTAVLSSMYGLVTSDPSTVTVTPAVGLAVSKSSHPSAVNAGEMITYTIVVSNNGQGYATDVVVSDTLPTNTRFVPNSIVLDPPDAGTVGTAPPILVSEMTIGSGQRVTVTFAVTVAAPLADGTIITNTVSVTSTHIPTPTTSLVTTTVHSPVFTLTKRVSAPTPSSPSVGAPITYAITITNTGQGVATNVIVTDALPAGANYITGGSLTPSGDVVNWTVPSIPAHAHDQVTFVVSTCQTSLLNASYRVVTSTQKVASPLGPPLLTSLAPPSLEADFDYDPPGIAVASTVTFTDISTTDGGPVVGRAWIFGDGGIGSDRTVTHVYSQPGTYTVTLTVTDTCGFTSTKTDTVLVYTPVLTVVKSAHAPAAQAGDLLTYTITASNGGPVHATGVTISDTLPSNVSFVAATSPYIGPVSGVVTWTLGTLHAGVGRVVTMVVWVDSAVISGTLIANTAWLTSEQGVAARDTVTTPVETSADLAITKSGDPGTVIPEQPLTYTLSIANHGPADARSVTITDKLPAGVTYYGDVVSVTPSLFGPTQTNGTLTWYTPTLRVGVSGAIIFKVTVDTDTRGAITNTAIITSTTTDPDTGNNAASETTNIPFPEVDFASATYAAGESDGMAVITLTLSAASSLSITADYTTSDGTATAGEDYVAVSGTLDFPPLALTRTFTVPIIPDLSNEPDETVVLSLTGATNAAVGTANNPATLTILDDEPDFAIIRGTVFLDINGNGLQDAAEVGIPDVLITLNTPSQKAITTTTDLDGNYIFSPTVPGVHTVVETEPMGYFSTTPDEVHVDVILGDAYWIDFGDAPIGSGFATIYGTVFLDYNGDGVYSTNEIGIPDVLITLNTPSLAAITTTTDLNGSYTFSTTVPGTHTVVETDPRVPVTSTKTTGQVVLMDIFDYMSTTPNEVHIDVTLGNAYQVDFGDGLTNLRFASIHGIAFEDVDGDGVQDAAELGIPNVRIALSTPSLATITTTTDLHGSYTFSATTPGTHVITATTPDGYFPTTPNQVHVDVILGTAYRVDFASAPIGSGFATIYGTVFNDSNGNGVYDRNETGIPEVLITLDPGSPVAITATTDLNGIYSLSTAFAGTHTVVETDLNNYISSTPNAIDVDVTLDNGYRVDFGDIEVTVCPIDTHEEDDTAAQARWFIIDSSAQAHNFCDDATDWVKFTAQVFAVYTITTSAYGQRADTILTLFDTDGQTELAANDDYPGATDHSSRIVWEASARDDYYVRITNQHALTGRGTDYLLWITRDSPPVMYLPLVVRNP